MNSKQLKKYRLACEVLAGKYTIKEFSILIGKSYRQSQRIIKRVEKEDYFGVFHKNFGKKPHNKTDEHLEALIVDLLTYKYNGFNLTHFKEMLEMYEHKKIAKSTLHRIARKHGLVKSPRKRVRRSFKPRPRMPREGMLIQFDGSHHLWFGDKKTDLLAAIDDATGKILNAEFFFGETSMNSLKVIKELVEDKGIPESFYMDQAGIYGKLDREWESQIARAFNQVNIQLILASSPQAKGRIERLFRTLQDRLIAEFKLFDIQTIEEANEYLKKTFIPQFNKQFSVKAEDDEPAYRVNVFGKLERIFCRKEKRKVGVGNVFSWNNVTWVINEKNCYRGREVNINTHIEGHYSFDIMGREVKAKVLRTNRIYDHKKRAI